MSAHDPAFELSSDSDDSREGTSFSPAQYLEDKTTDVATQVENENWDSHANRRLGHALESLDERSQHIVRSRWLDESKVTLQDLADEYQVSAERIRQLEQNAMKKLRSAML